MGNEYATPENDLPYVPDLHVRGTVTSGDGRGGTKLQFWFYSPRPKGVSIDEWDRIRLEKWEDIFGKKEK